MNKVKWHSGGILRLLFAVVLVAATCVPLPAQATAQDQQPPEKTVPAQIPPPDRPSIEQEPTKPVPPPQEPPKEKEEVKITPRQAEELFHSVDEILDFDSKQTGLPIKREVKRKLTSRDEVVSYLTKHLNDEDTQRLRRSELVLKKFGLLPRDFNLETFLVSLLREEVAGYYDPKTRTVNLLDWVPMEEQEPVMAHELTHALQDQSFGLQKWMKRGEKDLGEIKKDPTPADIENDEMDNAREAVVEGQAQAIMFQYAIAGRRHGGGDADRIGRHEGLQRGADFSERVSHLPLQLRLAIRRQDHGKERQGKSVCRRLAESSAHHATNHGARYLSVRRKDRAHARA
jgi:hypothetical protein